MYRPKEWEKKRDQWLNKVGGEFADSGEVMEASVIYEAGADAMLNGLLEQGSYMTPEQMMLLAPERKYPYGWLIFIPVNA